MMDGFIEACKAVDKKKNGKKGGRLVRKKRPFLNRLHVGFTQTRLLCQDKLGTKSSQEQKCRQKGCFVFAGRHVETPRIYGNAQVILPIQICGGSRAASAGGDLRPAAPDDQLQVRWLTKRLLMLYRACLGSQCAPFLRSVILSCPFCCSSSSLLFRACFNVRKTKIPARLKVLD